MSLCTQQDGSTSQWISAHGPACCQPPEWPLSDQRLLEQGSPERWIPERWIPDHGLPEGGWWEYCSLAQDVLAHRWGRFPAWP